MSEAPISFAFEKPPPIPSKKLTFSALERAVEIVLPGHFSRDYFENEYRVRANAAQGWRPITNVQLNGTQFITIREQACQKGPRSMLNLYTFEGFSQRFMHILCREILGHGLATWLIVSQTSVRNLCVIVACIGMTCNVFVLSPRRFGSRRWSDSFFFSFLVNDSYFRGTIPTLAWR